MKRLKIIFILFFINSTIFAQDTRHLSVVYLHDGSMIKGQVVEDHIVDIVKIKIIDGTELSIPLKTVRTIIKLNENIELLKNGKYVQTKGLYKQISLGTLTAWEDDEKEFIVWGASLFQMAIGYQFNQFVAVGGGFGMDAYDKEYFPVFADFRGYILNSRISLYYVFQAGYGISTDIFNSFSSNISFKGGPMIQPSLGLRFASLNNTKFIVEAGYKFQYDQRTNERNNTVDKIIFKRLALKVGLLF